MTIREITSLLFNDLKIVDPDTTLTRKYIFNKVVDTTKDFIKKSDLKKIYRDSTIFTSINCLLMETVPLNTCCTISIPNCTYVQKSIYKLPELYSGSLGQIINVFTGDGESYVMITPKNYKNKLKSEFKDNTKYFWIENDYIIIPNSETKKVKVSGAFIYRNKAKTLDDCFSNNERSCFSILESDFICPSYLQNDVIKATLQILLSTKNIPEDQNPNLNSNLK